MKLYLDNSFLNRPFDNPDAGLNRLESEILFFILDRVDEGKITLINSSVIALENSLNPVAPRKIFVEQVMSFAKVYQNTDDKIKKRASELTSQGLKPIDALHIAAAEAAEVDFLISCDYNLVKGYKGRLKVVSPIEFLKTHEGRNQN